MSQAGRPQGDMEQVLAQENPSTRELARLVATLSLPTILAEVCSTAMEYIDTAMVGSLGAQASAAVGLVASSTWLVGGVCLGLSTGFTVQIAQLVGAGRAEAARNVLRQAIVVLGVASVVLAGVCAALSGQLPSWLGGAPDVTPQAASYFLIYSLALPAALFMRLGVGALQCAGDMRTPSLLSMLMCLLDVVFNFFLVFPSRELVLGGLHVWMPGAGLGVAGAALGTAAAEVVVGALLFWAACVRSEKLALFGRRAKERASEHPSNESRETGNRSSMGSGMAESAQTLATTGRGAAARGMQPVKVLRRPKALGPWRPRASCLLAAAKVAGPICLERVVLNGAQIVSVGIVAPLGTVAVAAHSLAITAEGICYMPGFGVAAAATTLVGQTFGAGRRDLARRLANLCVALGMAIMTCTGAAMYLLAPAVFALFTPDTAVQALGSSVLRIELFAEPLFAAAIVTMGALRGAGDTLVPTLLNIATMWGVRITLAFALVPSLGLAGVWVAMLVELCVRGTLFLVRLKRGKWLERETLVG